MTTAKAKPKAKARKKSRAKRGHPAFEPTHEQRRDVELYAAARISEPAIAREIGICQNTLRKHFKAELAAGRDREKARNLKRLREAADKSNVAAIKELQRMIDAARDFDPDLDRLPVSRSAEPRPAKQGKKEIQREEAISAGVNSDWGDDLAPPPGTAVN